MKNSVCNSDLVEAEKAVSVFQIHLGRAEVEESLAEGCRLGLLEVLRQRSLAGSDKHAVAVAPLVPVVHLVFHGDTGNRREQRSPR